MDAVLLHNIFMSTVQILSISAKIALVAEFHHAGDFCVLLYYWSHWLLSISYLAGAIATIG